MSDEKKKSVVMNMLKSVEPDVDETENVVTKPSKPKKRGNYVRRSFSVNEKIYTKVQMSCLVHKMTPSVVIEHLLDHYLKNEKKIISEIKDLQVKE